MRDDNEFKPSNCTCTTPFFNVHCGCLLSTPNWSNKCAYQNWTNSCSQSNITTDGVSAWLMDQDVPDWAWTVASSDGFNNLRIEQSTWTFILFPPFA
ncbi:hypothetical protein AN958_00192 [Leucoagaricus sp. SymC.cos]|nr:hypothetical protein AN958_00192 [Leucoagaricus sp. SymC.cos]